MTEHEKVPDEYITKTKPIAERQLVLGGYRLAYQIEKIFGQSAFLQWATLMSRFEATSHLALKLIDLSKSGF